MAEPAWLTQARKEGRILSERQVQAKLADTPGLPGLDGEDIQDAPASQRFEMPYPPTVNTYWRSVIIKTKKGEPSVRLFISDRGRAYQKTVAARFKEWGGREMKGPLAFKADFHPPDRRSRDLDNLLKSIIDALANAGAYENDDQIKEIHVRFGKPLKGGMAYVTLAQLPT